MPIRRILGRQIACPREALARAVSAWQRPITYAALSRMLGHGDGYLHRFVHHGVPAALSARDHELLAAFFGIHERELGVRQLWVPLAA